MTPARVLSRVAFLFFILVLVQGVSAAPVAGFTGSPTSGEVPLDVAFTDESTGVPTGWAWFFGDETYSGPWAQVNASAGWSPRDSHSSVAMPDGSIVLMGGIDNSGYRNDVWRSTDNGAGWTEMTGSAGWTARYRQTSVAMPDGSIVLMGGIDSSGYRNDVWRSTDNGASWTEMTGSAGWTARHSHSSVVLPDGSIILMGGYDGIDKNDVWKSTDAGETWTEVNASAGWTGREAFSSVAMPDGSIVLMGGLGGIDTNDVWRSADNGVTWTEMTGSAGWTARHSHSSVVMPDGSIVLMGGYADSSVVKNDVWRSTDNGVTWSEVNASAGWTARVDHRSVVLPDGSILLTGGTGSSSPHQNDVWQLNPAGSSAQNPSHTYTTPGLYKVALQAYNADGYNSLITDSYIDVTAGVTAARVHNLNTGLNFTTIQAAIDDAGTLEGDILEADPGTYIENVDVDKSVFLRSASGNPEDTIIQAADVNDHVISVTADYVHVRGFTVTGTAETGGLTGGVCIDSADYGVIENMNSINNDEGFCNLWGSSHSVFINSTARDNHHNGIFLWDADNTTIVNNTLISNGHHGIILYVNGQDNTIINNRIIGNHPGISISPDSGNNRIWNNYFNNTHNGYDGGSNSWNTTKTSGTTIIGGSWLGGNYWSDYSGVDADGDGLGDTALPYNNGITSGGDWLPLTDAGYFLPVADFSANTTSGTAPLSVQFTDTSTGSPTAWNWSFGDGSNSTLQNPVHTYLIPDTYTVGLTVNNASGTDTEEKTGYITVSVPLTTGPVHNLNSGLNYTSVQSAINAPETAAGNTILVDSGVYPETLTVNKQLTLLGHDTGGGRPVLVASGGTAVTLTANGIILDDFILQDTGSGIVVQSDNNRISNNTLIPRPEVGVYGITVSGHHHNVITGNKVSRYNTTTGTGYAIWITAGSTYNTISENVVNDNKRGIFLYSSSNYNIVTNNSASRNYWDGICVWLSGYNSLYGNEVTSNNVGIKFWNNSGNNEVYRNNIINNTVNADTGNSINTWNSPSSGLYSYKGVTYSNYTGNYWSTYSGPDANNDGIGDTAHAFPAVGQDVYPLTGPWSGDQIIPGAEPVADFSGTPTGGVAPLTVQFTDESANGPTSWLWSFGDGNSSTLRNPSFTYSIPGLYTVSLTATNTNGSDTNTRTHYISVDAPPVLPVADFTGTPTSGTAPLSVAFTDLSSNSPTAWNWSFGDGTFSLLQNPVHAYGATGNYTVNLTVSNTDGDDSMSRAGYIQVRTSANDNTFDSMTAGLFPPGWGQIYNGAEWPAAFVDSSQSVSAPNSFKLQGRSGWAQRVGRKILPPLDETITYDYSSGLPVSEYDEEVAFYQDHSELWLTADVMTGDPGPIAADRWIAALSFHKVTPVWGQYFGIVWFSTNPVAGSYIGAGGAQVPYQFNRWYTITIATNLTSRTASVWVDGTLISDNASISSSYYPEMVALEAGNAATTHVWFDNVNIGFGNPPLPPPSLNANFTANITAGTAPLSVRFTDTSTGSPSGWNWSFGDGNFSEETSPLHIYTSRGSFNVSLMVTDLNTRNSTVTKPGYIQVSPGLVPNFTGEPQCGQGPLAVRFTDTSTGPHDRWAWAFGEGGTSTEKNPVYTYSEERSYNVSLFVDLVGGGEQGLVSKSDYIRVIPPAVTSFTASDTSGYSPLTVRFTDTSTGYLEPVTYLWDFGDGQRSAGKNPVHIYTISSASYTYPVTLTVSGYCGQTQAATQFITVEFPPPVSALFTSDVTEGIAPITVNFKDTSTGDPVAWLWDFGDGSTSALQNPSHTYAASGLYTVTLQVTSSYGSSTTTEVPDYIGSFASSHDLVFSSPGLSGTTDIVFDSSVFAAAGGSYSLSGPLLILDYPASSPFRQLVITLDPATISQVGSLITGHVVSVTLETGDLDGDLAAGAEKHTIVYSLNAVPLPGSTVQTDTIDNADPTSQLAFETLAAHNNMTLLDTCYEMFVATTIPGSSISSSRITMMVPRDWYDTYRSSTISIIGVSSTGDAAFLSTGSPTVNGNYVRFSAPSLSGYDTFGIAALQGMSPPPSDAGDSGDGTVPSAATIEQAVVEHVAPAPVVAPVVQHVIEHPVLPPAPQKGIEQLAPPGEGESVSSSADSGPDEQAPMDIIRQATRSGNVTLPLSPVIPDKYAPLAAVAAGVAITILGTLASVSGLASWVWDKIIALLEKFLSSETIGLMSAKEVEKRGLHPSENLSSIIFGISAREMLVIGLSTLGFAAAWILQDRLEVRLVTLLIFVCVGGIATILHDLAHKYCAYRTGFVTEYKLWGLGLFTMLSTAWLFGNAFAKPSRTLIRSEKTPSLEEAAIIKLAGPLVSLGVAVLSLFLIPLGGLFVIAGSAGFSMNLLNGVFSLVPVKPNDGVEVYAWNKFVWAIMFIPLIVFYLWVYLQM